MDLRQDRRATFRARTRRARRLGLCRRLRGCLGGGFRCGLGRFSGSRRAAHRFAGIALAQPLAELRHRQVVHGAFALPVVRVVRGVRLLGLGLAVETDHRLVLVELAGLGIHLVDDVHAARFGVRAHERVDVIAVRARGALHVAVGVRQRGLPRRAVAIGPAAHRAGRVLDRDRQARDVHVPLGIIAGRLLQLRRLHIDAHRLTGHLGLDVARLVGLQQLYLRRWSRCRYIRLGS